MRIRDLNMDKKAVILLIHPMLSSGGGIERRITRHWEAGTVIAS